MVRKVEHSDNRYAPPVPRTIRLSEALQNTSRFPVGQQRMFGGSSMPNDLLLYYAGDISLLQGQCVAIVGTREVSTLGMQRTTRLAKDLAKAGVIVVSGLAAGVDTAALTSAMETGGRVVAVIGTPLDRAYPAQNKTLQEEIYRNHLLISQFPIGSNVQKSNFPQRNRLMAVISDATVVMEASDTSGTLHQAAECSRLERRLFIDKSVTENSLLQWPEKFLKYDTTTVVETADDITRIYRDA